MDRTSLSRATESSEAPCPGYLFLDIAKSTASNPNACRETAQYLIKRLSTKQNHNIKYKCLKVIQKTAESPLTRGQFKREIAQDPSAVTTIKNLLQFRGPPDPVRGDEIYARVREAAKECLDVIYSDNPSSDSGPGFSSYNAGLSGNVPSGSYGQPPAGGMYGGNQGQYGQGAPGASGPRKMEGIGNPMFSDPRSAPAEKNIGTMTIGEVAGVVGETVINMIKDPLAKNVPVRPNHSMPSVHVNYGGGGSNNRVGNLPGYGASSGNYGQGTQPPGARELYQHTGGQWSMASNRGPNAVNPNNYGNSGAPAPGVSSYDKAKESTANAFQWAQNQNTSSSNMGGVGGSWAQSAPSSSGGVAAQARAAAHGYSTPSSSTYSNVGNAASDGTYEKNLIQELCPPGGMRAEPPEDKLAKFAKNVPSLNPDLVCPALLDALEDGQPWMMKAKALCVVETTIKVAKESGGESNPYSDFFHTCSAEIEPLASHARPAVREPAKRVLRALGINIDPFQKQAKAAPQTAPPPVPPPQPEPAADLLGFDDDFGAATAPAPAPVAPPPEPSVAPPEPPTSAPPAPGNGASLFGGLQVQSPQPTAPPTAPPAVPSSSGFDFISKSNEPETPAKVIEDTPAPAPASTPAPISAMDELLSLGLPTETSAPAPMKKAMNGPPAFDPLGNMGASTQPNLTQGVGNSQTQAMAYQQNMMLMQQQMQQMQMAMAMQQQQQKINYASAPGGSANNTASVMSSNTMRFIPNMSGGPGSGQFSFLESAKKEEQEKSFDFVKDAVKSAK